MKIRKSVLLIGALILLAGIGIIGQLVKNPAGFFQQIALMVLFGLVIFFLFRRFTGSSPNKKEQRLFLKAARESKKRNAHKNEPPGRNVIQGSLASWRKPKKKANVHLTVIEGKKGKKKNRASL
ncbi:hypothetical protein D1B31_09105 [Neobacillus notoginsengisoli]|uniref:Uncharacterized protein n=1 Tax=Neobacillus notoginsengisoli TaxID=1578198 RepID=A0A417YUW4_9BACI|nr:hypothetical protein D1B31_09105 [Neobacillus notoginsengisoli]